MTTKKTKRNPSRSFEQLLLELAADLVTLKEIARNSNVIQPKLLQTKSAELWQRYLDLREAVLAPITDDHDDARQAMQVITTSVGNIQKMLTNEVERVERNVKRLDAAIGRIERKKR